MMLSTLRRRFIFSHILPLVVITPLIGLALIYFLETRVLLPDLASELASDATLVAQVARDQPGVWISQAQAQAFVAFIGRNLKARVMLLNPYGVLLASSDPADARLLGERLALPTLDVLRARAISIHVAYSRDLQAEVADVLVPVLGPGEGMLGVVRLTHRLASVYERFARLRYLVTGILAVGLLVGTIMGWVLALDLERPLKQITRGIEQLGSSQPFTPLPEHGPEEIRMLSRAFNALVGRLHSLEQARRQLLANLVHELGRPLGAIHSATQALRGGADQDAALRQELLAGMDAQARGLQRLLDDLARLYEQVLGPLDLDRQPVALSDWLPQILAPWREATYAKGLGWQAILSTTLPTLDIDTDRMAQVLGNLLSNAIKYTEPPGAVAASADVEGDEVWIRVSDSGPGITVEEQAHLFTPFYRGRQGRRFPQGMGLGLSIARELVVAHGGRLEVDSTPGAGSRFTIWLPKSLPALSSDGILASNRQGSLEGREGA